MTVSGATRPALRATDPTDDTMPVAVLGLVAAFTAAVVAQGGYYLPGRLLVILLVAASLVATLPGRPWSVGDLWPVPAACAALGGWALIRAAFAGGYPAAAGEAATLGCLVAVLLVLRRTGWRARERLAGLLVGIGALVAVTVWLGVAWRLRRLAVLVDQQLWRGGGTLTYPNAAAALLVSLALLAIALPAATPRAPGRPATRYLLLVGVGATLSRAGLLALAIGLVVLAVLAGPGQTVRRAAGPLIGAAVATGALAPSFPVRAQPHPALAVAGLLAGAAVALGPEYLPRRVRAAATGGVLVLAGVVLWTRLGTGAAHNILRSRWSVTSSGRSGALHAALRLIADRPLTGTGVGQARFVWVAPDGTAQIALYAHDEYLQTLVDLGAIGLALLLALLAAMAVTLYRARGCDHRPGVRAGAIAALAALAAHSGFDFLWHLAVLPLAAALFLGLAASATGGGTPIDHHEGEMA
ncbi:hypothetical protein GCM10023322_13110 [Rugosimonospora acidiphila]|uniref:O-antigen ligase-related domain-containing protein n=1 Tax=Rugosimonospora acidiphila TaxID=556531 RepID=A0ABP9RNB5_9ACTN